MQWLDLTLLTPAENLAVDEALLDASEMAGGEVLRFWESRDYFVTLGFANHLAQEVDEPACLADHVPILRRCTGGGTVLQGPGCLNYAVVLRLDRAPEYQSITATNRCVLTRIAGAIGSLLPPEIKLEGDTDLTVAGRKFSGNAQRRRRTHLLFHGTLLLGFDPRKISRYLLAPPRQPAYRRQRLHEEFVTNLPLSSAEVKAALRKVWDAREPGALPAAEVAKLVSEKYSREEWTRRF